jgi:hypothetical protein
MYAETHTYRRVCGDAMRRRNSLEEAPGGWLLRCWLRGLGTHAATHAATHTEEHAETCGLTYRRACGDMRPHKAPEKHLMVGYGGVG